MKALYKNWKEAFEATKQVLVSSVAFKCKSVNQKKTDENWEDEQNYSNSSDAFSYFVSLFSKNLFHSSSFDFKED